MALNTFTLFLIKDHIRNIRDVFTELATAQINSNNAIVSRNYEFAENAEVFIFRNPPTPPKWLKHIEQSFSISDQIRNQFSSAVLLFWAAGRLFAVAFGRGWLYLDSTKFVPDFGLRVALNAASDDKIKRLDFANLGEAIRGVTQSANQRGFENFGIDEALELVRKVSGAIRDDGFGKSVTGSNSLKIFKEMELIDLPDLAARSIQYYNSTDYKDTAFHVVDNIFPELDQTVVDSLNDAAAKSISGGQTDFELGLPEFSEHDFACFWFVGMRNRNHYSDLQLAHYRQMLGTKINNLCGKDLIKHRIKAEYIDSDKLSRELTIHQALVGSLELDGERYAINEGRWYKVDAAFKKSIDNSFAKSVLDFDIPPPVIKLVGSADNRKQYLENESEYNERYAKQHNLLLMDRVLVSVPEIPRSQTEICDLLDTKNKRLIHVKMSGRQSSVLSHFFKQGANSARIIKTFDNVWNNAIEKVEERFGESAARELEQSTNEATPWTIEFHIADSPRPNGQYLIPFFSRVTFRDEKRTMQNMGYRVFIRFIRKPSVNLRG